MPQYQLNGYDESGELVFTADVPPDDADAMCRCVFAATTGDILGILPVTPEVVRRMMPDLVIPDPAPALFLEDCAGW